jgi:hypothetical protein
VAYFSLLEFFGLEASVLFDFQADIFTQKKKIGFGFG